MDAITGWVTGHIAPYIALLWSIDQLLKIVGKTFNITVIDNLADGLGSVLSTFFRTKQQ